MILVGRYSFFIYIKSKALHLAQRIFPVGRLFYAYSVANLNMKNFTSATPLN